MVSTYVNNLRLEEMATGANSGAWGTKTNVNLELVGQALGYGTRAIANASTDNITIADGTSDADRSMYLKLTGGGQACTITLLPNTSSKMWVMENATSFALTFTQGSGANVVVAAGQTKLIFADGLGSGAVVHELGALTLNGDVTTAGTFNALGDTSAADKALGYTAAEGLILTGQGSTNDVTIKNDADADVLEIPTGTTNVTVVGNITAGGDITAVGSIDFGDGHSIGNDVNDNLAIISSADENIILGPAGGVVNLADDKKITFGNGQDLEIYHDASNSIIKDSGVGRLYIAASTLQVTNAAIDETSATFSTAGAATLYFANASKFATTATGVAVTGTVLATTDTDTSNTGSVTLDFAANQNFVLTLTGNVTLANPSTEQVGQAGVFVFIQDGTGSRTLSLGTDYETPAGGGITLSTAAGSVDVVPYFVKASGSIQLGTPQLAFS